MTHGEACADYDHSIRQSTASFDVLAAECSDDNSNPEHYPISIHDVHEVVEVVPDHPEDKGLKPEGFKKNKRKKKKKRKKNKNKSRGNCSQEIPIQSSLASGAGEELVSGAMFYKRRSVVEPVFENSVVLDLEVLDWVQESCGTSIVRQRNVNGRRVRENVFVEENSSNNSNSTKDSSMVQWGPVVSNGNKDKLEKELSLDWSKVMEKHHGVLGGTSPTERLPFRYFMGEIYNGNTLRSTISVGNERKRQGVYNTMFYVPLKCERLILAGFLVCLDSFLSLLTITPARILLSLWRALDIRQFRRPDATELSDFGCFVILACGVVTLQSTDISLIYHFIRGQGTIKLYVVYNVLEIFDKLLQSFGEDVLQVLFSSADGLATCSAHDLPLILLRFFLDQTIAAVAFVVHSFILLAQAITLSTCIIAHNNALMALLVSNNFAEIKSNVFKKVSKDNLHSVVYYDIIERFHITAFVIFVLAQNILEAEESWFGSFVDNALLVFICEVIIDTIKHAFLAKFNEIKPEAYSDFLEDLCKQVLNMQPDEDRKNLTFIPLAPACVVIRVLTPIYASLLPHGPLGWRWFWIAFWSILTFVILAVCKTLVGLTLNRLATWYINQRLASKQHVD